MAPKYPWRDCADLGMVLASVKPIFASLLSVESSGGHSDLEIISAERRIGTPLPEAIREFYRAMRPTPIFNPPQREFGFYPLNSTELAWHSMQGAEPEEAWSSARGLALGQSTYGDPFWWIEGHRFLPDGSITLLDHEDGVGGEVLFVHFARSFPEFIAKVAHFRGRYPRSPDTAYRQEYLELNPSAKR